MISISVLDIAHTVLFPPLNIYKFSSLRAQCYFLSGLPHVALTEGCSGEIGLRIVVDVPYSDMCYISTYSTLKVLVCFIYNRLI